MAAGLTHDLLRDFADTEPGRRYAADSHKILLLTTYILLRQLTPALTFEEFLARFQAIADFDETNRKHPEDAVRHHCPRAQKVAQARGVPQWTAEEVTDILVLYVDMCRAADAAGVEVPMSLDEYLAMDGPAYKAGQVAPPERTARSRGPKRQAAQPGVVAGDEPPAEKPARSRSRAAAMPSRVSEATGVNPAAPLLPTAAGQRVIYTNPGQGGRQLRGWVLAISDADARGYRYVDFQTESGELYRDCAVTAFQVTDVQQPPTALPPTATLTVPAVEAARLVEMLKLDAPVGNVAIGQPCWTGGADLPDNLAFDIQVMNAQPRPCVDAQLSDRVANVVLVDAEPRENLFGDYRFDYAGKTYVVAVRPGV